MPQYQQQLLFMWRGVGCSSSSRNIQLRNMDARVWKCALQLEDSVLLAKLSAGELISQEAVYHFKCWFELYNKARNDSDNTEKRDEDIFQGIALAHLVEYIEETQAELACEQALKVNWEPALMAYNFEYLPRNVRFSKYGMSILIWYCLQLSCELNLDRAN